MRRLIGQFALVISDHVLKPVILWGDGFTLEHGRYRRGDVTNLDREFAIEIAESEFNKDRQEQKLAVTVGLLAFIFGGAAIVALLRMVL